MAIKIPLLLSTKIPLLKSTRQLPVPLWYTMTIMFNDDDFITGLALGTIIASGDSMPEWRWSAFLVYGAAALAAAVVCGTIAYLLL